MRRLRSIRLQRMPSPQSHEDYSHLRRLYLHLLVPSIARINATLRHAPASTRARAVRRAADRCLLRAAAISPSASLLISRRRFITSPTDYLRIFSDSRPRRPSSSMATVFGRHQHLHKRTRIHPTTKAKAKRQTARVSYIKVLRSNRAHEFYSTNGSQSRLSADCDDESGKRVHSVVVSGVQNNHLHHDPRGQEQQSSYMYGRVAGNYSSAISQGHAGSRMAIPNQDDLSRLHDVLFSDHRSLLVDLHASNHARPQGNRLVGHRYTVNGNREPAAVNPTHDHSSETNFFGSRGLDHRVDSVATIESSNHNAIINPATLLSQAAHYILALQLQVDTLQALLNSEISPASLPS